MHKRHPGFVLLLLLLVIGPVVGIASDTPDALNQAVAERHIIPAYARLAQHAAALDEAARHACRGDNMERDMPRATYEEAFLAWQGVQHVRLGPIVAFTRDFRFQLWPDKRGSVRKHLAQLMTARDPAVLDADTFAKGSVAVQGFSALERLLYGPAPAAADYDWHCRVITTITGNLAGMAADVLSEWRDGPEAHRHFFATASQGNTYYDSADVLSARLLNNLHTQLERIVDQKLAHPLGDEIAHARPKRAEAWRSGLSLAAIQHNLAALDELYRLGFAARLEDPLLRRDLEDRFTAARTLAGSFDAPLARVVTDPETRPTLASLRDDLAALDRVVAGELSATLDLPLGFNSLDGD